MFKVFKDWLKERDNVIDVECPNPKPTKRILHGHDLDDWHYLGFVTLELNEVKHPTFLFVSKDDFSVRSYEITGPHVRIVEERHQYVSANLEPWRIGEKDIYTYVRTQPSDWLCNYMLDTFGVEWNEEDLWWTSTESAKHKRSVRKQQKEQETKTVEVSDDNKVVSVDFSNKGN